MIYSYNKNQRDALLPTFVLVSNQRDAAFVLLGLLSLYMFRTRCGSRSSSGVIHKTVMAATSVCQRV